jgi:Der1-like family
MGPSFAITKQRTHVRCRHGGSIYLRKAHAIFDNAIGDCDFLHCLHLSICFFLAVALEIEAIGGDQKAPLTLSKATAGLLLNANVFTHALLLALAYTYASDNRGKRVTFVIIQIPVEYLPWAMLTITLVLSGWPAALQEGMGIVAAHLYDFLTRLYPTFQGGRNWVQTPAFISTAFGADRSAFTQKSYGASFRPAAARPAAQASSSSGSSTGWTSALGGSWGGRGAGRRLGGD